MKYLIGCLSLLSAIYLTGCKTNAKPPKRIGMPNPASVFCIQQGGEVILKKDENNASYGMCKFKDGSEIEEWAYFRAHHKAENETQSTIKKPK